MEPKASRQVGEVSPYSHALLEVTPTPYLALRLPLWISSLLLPPGLCTSRPCLVQVERGIFLKRWIFRMAYNAKEKAVFLNQPTPLSDKLVFRLALRYPFRAWLPSSFALTPLATCPGR